jgi:hypothetical protein
VAKIYPPRLRHPSEEGIFNPSLKGYRVYTSRFELMRRSKSPNPLGKGAKIRILVPLFKGDLGGFLGFSLFSKDVYTR